jgi:hypothetical protein
VRALAAAALALVLVLATPAAADVVPRGTAAVGPALAGDVVPRRTAAVGPALAGDVVVWGEEAHTGAVRVVARAPGRAPWLIHRIAPPTAAETERGFGGVPATFAASATTFAALAHTATVTLRESDSVSTAYTNAVVGGPLRGPVRVLAGCIPARGDHGCGDACGGPTGVDVDGDRIAVLASSGPCKQREGWRDSIAVDGRTVAAGPPHSVLEMALAGRYLAWFPHDGELVVHDLTAREDVLRLRARDVGARGFDELALQPDGVVAFTTYRRRGPGHRLLWTAPGRPGVRLVDRRAAYRDIALSGGRILYERLLSERRFTAELILRPLAGGGERKLAHFPERRRRIGDLDLDATRATWADRPVRRGYEAVPRGPGRIIVRRL